MQIKKYEAANLEKRKGAYFAVGLLFVMALLFCLFELKVYDFGSVEYKKLHLDLIEAEVVPISQQTPPPPPPPPQSTTQIQIVANEAEIKLELEIEDMEIDDDTHVESSPLADPIEMDEEEIEEEEIFTIVEKMPQFPGGLEALFQYLGTNIEYPAMAKDSRIEGKVYITFIVNSKGDIDDVRVLRGIGGGCDEEAVRVIKAMPNWEPGRQRGKAVKVQYNIPVNFILN